MVAKRRSYFAELISKAWEDVEFVEVISEAAGGIMVAFLLLRTGVAERAEMKELYFEGVLCAISIPFIAFLLRVIFVTPSKLYRELSERRERGRAQESAVLPAKESQIIGILLAFCSILAFLVIIEILPISKSEKPEAQKELLQQAESHPKRLPDAAIPALQSPQSVPAETPQVATVEPQKQLETNTPDKWGVESELTKLKADQKAEKLANRQKNEQIADAIWATNLPSYNYTLEVLYQILSEEASKQGDGIAKTSDYFRCLPTTFNHSKTENTDLTEIRFQKNTNMDFKIMISPENWFNDRFMQSGELRINCSCGELKLPTYSRPGINIMYVMVNMPDFHYQKEATVESFQELRDHIKLCVKLLVDGQIDFANKTNKTL